MRILFIGTVGFSYRILEIILGKGYNVVGVCTKNKSLFNADYRDLTPLCESFKIPVNYVNDINSGDSVEWISNMRPDVIFCFGWSSLIKSELLRLPPIGVLGFHPAKLSENRGCHPIIWALVLGLQETASTFFFMKEGVDDGDILSQKTVKINSDYTVATLYDRIVSVASKQVKYFLPLLKSGKYKTVKQDLNITNVWRKRSNKDDLIDFRMSSDAIYNLVRALTKPYVGVLIWIIKVLRLRSGKLSSMFVLQRI